MQPALEAIAKQYQAKTGQAIAINEAGSGELLAHIQMQKEGDLYVCHDPFVDMLMQKYKLGVDAWVVSELTPVIVVRKGNPKNIRGLADLTRPGLAIALTDYTYSSLGWMLPALFRKAGVDFESLKKQKNIVTNRSGGYAANLVQTGNADVAIVWNAVAWLRRDALDVVPIEPPLLPPDVDAVSGATGRKYKLVPMRVTVATLTCSRQPDAARRFAEYVASPAASRVFQEFGFTPAAGAQVYERGRPLVAADRGPVVLKLLAGAGLRTGVDQLAEAFFRATGIRVEPDYGGSGLILARARASRDADLFLPGEGWYVDRLQELAGTVDTRATVAWFVPVLIVGKGNPKTIRQIPDLARDGVLAGLGGEEACEVGRAATQILAKYGMSRTQLRVKEALTVNELGVWVQMRDVDAAIVWDAIAAGLGDAVETIAIPPASNVVARVEIALLKSSRNTDAARRWIEFLQSEEGRKILRAAGYRIEDPEQGLL